MITTGVLGGRWRASVTPWGDVEPWNGDADCQWHIAADDRWHSPQREPAVRQRRIDGTAVVETRMRIPDGDAVQRVYSVADYGGLTVIEVENASPLPIAVAFTRGDLLTMRPPAAPIEGIDLPSGSVAFPVGHRARIAVAIPHSSSAVGLLPSLRPAAGVVRGWLTTAHRAGRFLLPDPALSDRVVAERCELALAGPASPDDDPVGFLLGVAQLVRIGEPVDPWLPDVARALESAARSAPRDWSLTAAIDGADRVLALAGDGRAQKDLAAMRKLVTSDSDSTAPVGLEPVPADGGRFLAWVEAVLVGDCGRLMPFGMPTGWMGANFEVYGLSTGSGGEVSFAIRWHGDRLAVLWEQQGEPCLLTSPVLAPGWSTSDTKGETLWPVPPSSVAESA